MIAEVQDSDYILIKVSYINLSSGKAGGRTFTYRWLLQGIPIDVGHVVVTDRGAALVREIGSDYEGRTEIARPIQA